mgnify:CR=1 FL=1
MITTTCDENSTRPLVIVTHASVGSGHRSAAQAISQALEDLCGKHPSFNLFFKLVTLFDISVDQFFYTEGHRGEGSCRKHIDVLLSSMNEKELVVMEATAEGLKKARETEVQE